MARYVLRIAGGATDGRELELTGPVEIGRDPAAGLALPDDQLVSSRHARVSPHADGAVVEDLGSRNGTFVNNVRIAEPTLIRPGDVLQIGNTTIAVVVAQEAAPAGFLLQLSGPRGSLGQFPLAQPLEIGRNPVGRPRADGGSPGVLDARPARAARGRRGRGGSRLTERDLRERHTHPGAGAREGGRSDRRRRDDDRRTGGAGDARVRPRGHRGRRRPHAGSPDEAARDRARSRSRLPAPGRPARVEAPRAGEPDPRRDRRRGSGIAERHVGQRRADRRADARRAGR